MFLVIVHQLMIDLISLGLSLSYSIFQPADCKNMPLLRQQKHYDCLWNNIIIWSPLWFIYFENLLIDIILFIQIVSVRNLGQSSSNKRLLRSEFHHLCIFSPGICLALFQDLPLLLDIFVLGIYIWCEC